MVLFKIIFHELLRDPCFNPKYPKKLNLPWYTDEIADDPFNVLGFDPFALGGRREANNRSATVVSTTGKQREPFLQQWQYVQRPYAVHGAGRRRPLLVPRGNEKKLIQLL